METGNKTLVLSYGENAMDNLTMAKELWNEFGDIPIDNNDCITCQWRTFEKGTYRFDIWRWFEEFFEVSVAEDLME